jgi:hypothetical protein
MFFLIHPNVQSLAVIDFPLFNFCQPIPMAKDKLQQAALLHA